MEAQGIDISHWNEVTNFASVKASGISFVIIKAGGSDKGLYTDRKFADNYRRAKQAGLNVGAYYFVGPKFQGEANGIADAQRFLKICEGKTFEYPLYLDIESTPANKREGTTAAAIAFLKTLEHAGCYAGFYTSDGLYRSLLIPEKLRAFDRWAARYSKHVPQAIENYGVWQYTDKGRVDGVRNYVDRDIAYKDYPAVMKERGFNTL